MSDTALPSLRGTTYAEAQQSHADLQAGLRSQRFIDGLGDFSLGMQVVGAASQAIGNYYAVQAQQDQLKARALSESFAAQVAEFNKNIIEQEAARIGEAAQYQIGLSRMRYAEAQASARVSAAARGVKVDSGSAAETERTLELMSQIDAMTIEANADERIADVEQRAASQGSRAILSRASAANIRATARTLSPAAAFLTTDIGNAGRVGASLYRRYRS